MSGNVHGICERVRIDEKRRELAYSDWKERRSLEEEG